MIIVHESRIGLDAKLDEKKEMLSALENEVKLLEHLDGLNIPDLAVDEERPFYASHPEVRNIFVTYDFSFGDQVSVDKYTLWQDSIQEHTLVVNLHKTLTTPFGDAIVYCRHLNGDNGKVAIAWARHECRTGGVIYELKHSPSTPGEIADYFKERGASGKMVKEIESKVTEVRRNHPEKYLRQNHCIGLPAANQNNENLIF